MNNGYQQFFKKAQQVASGVSPKSEPKIKIREDYTSTDSQILAQQLRSRLKAKSKSKHSRSRIPWKLVGPSIFGVVITGFGFTYAGNLDKYLKNVEISFLGLASAEEPAQAPAVTTTTLAPSPTKKEFTQDEIDHFAKLNERKRELDAREEELTKTEAEIAAQKADLEKRLKDLESTRRQISSVLDDRVQTDDKKVDSLVQVYSNMKPLQAAKILETMDDDLAIEILGRMKKKPAAEILNLIKPERAQVFAERYAGYKRK